MSVAQVSVEGGEARESEAAPSRAAWYLIFVLTLAYTASFIDRQVLNLLIGPLKADFGLTDTKLSLLQGLAFTTAYILFSPVFGRLADVGSRRGILIFGIGIWSLGTSLCGLSRTYVQLFFARFGVGASEACLTPAAWSIIADSFPAKMIPRAFSIYMMGPYLGGGLALVFGGLVLDGASHWDLTAVPFLGAIRPWQVVFLLAGVPGIAIAALAFFVKEPPRRESGLTVEKAKPMPLRDVWAVFVDRRGFYGNFYAGFSAFIIALYAFPAWMPAVLMRKFGAPAATVGVEYGLLVLVTGSVGVFCGPWVAGWLERRGRQDALLLVGFGAAIGLILVSMSLAFASTYGAALTIATIASLLYSLPQALASAALQLVTPNRMRGVAASLYVFVVSVVGLGASPTIVALLTDHVFKDEMRVDDSLAVTCLAASSIAAFFIWRALKSYRLLLSLPE